MKIETFLKQPFRIVKLLAVPFAGFEWLRLFSPRATNLLPNLWRTLNQYIVYTIEYYYNYIYIYRFSCVKIAHAGARATDTGSPKGREKEISYYIYMYSIKYTRKPIRSVTRVHICNKNVCLIKFAQALKNTPIYATLLLSLCELYMYAK